MTSIAAELKIYEKFGLADRRTTVPSIQKCLFIAHGFGLDKRFRIISSKYFHRKKFLRNFTTDLILKLPSTCSLTDLGC